MKLNIAGHRTADNVTLRAAILALCALSLVACGDDDVGDMPIIMIDAGRDMNTGVDMFVRPDMGMVRTCGAAPMALPDTAVPRCADSTIDCLTATGCTTVACQMACFAADPVPATTVGGSSVDCSGCLNAEILACASAGPCENQWNALACCIVDNCGGMFTEACAVGDCAGATGALQTCANSAMACTTAAIGRCGGAVVDTDGGIPADGGEADGATPVDGGDADAGTDDAGTDDAGTEDAGPTPTP